VEEEPASSDQEDEEGERDQERGPIGRAHFVEAGDEDPSARDHALATVGRLRRQTRNALAPAVRSRNKAGRRTCGEKGSLAATGASLMALAQARTGSAVAKVTSATERGIRMENLEQGVLP
tara:strand:- start:1408 stop:1770 length:363 start_codon:yes stop_codon:yes gene_type:complete